MQESFQLRPDDVRKNIENIELYTMLSPIKSRIVEKKSATKPISPKFATDERTQLKD